MIPERVTSNGDAAVALLTDRFRNKVVIPAMLRAFVAPFDDLEGSLWDVINGRTLDNAAGVWIDALGAIVGEDRQGRDDVAYKRAVRLRIRVNRSQGRTIDILDVMRLWSVNTFLTEYSFLSWEVNLLDDPHPEDLIGLLGETKAVTSYGQLTASTWPSSGVFSFCHYGATPASNQLFWSAYVA